MKKNWQKVTNKGLDHAHYQADALILYCVDNRGKKAFEEFLFKKRFQRYDLIMIPGGAKSLTENDEVERQIILDYIKKLVGLHKAEKIILTTHADCGACGGSAAFGNDAEKERRTHEQWLVSAKSFLSERFVVPVEIYFVDFEGFWQIT
ncbi:MAG: hypothetical protein Q8O66_02225 [bacterium]|nr:hypothetical protein [bacterium]